MTSSKIYLGMCVYLEAEIIAQSLRSILPFVDGVIMVDGALLGYPMSDDYSVDGTVDLARYVTTKEWNKDFVSIQLHERTTEMVKRTAYLEYVQKNMDWTHTWVLVWDADDFLAPFDGQKGESTAEADMKRLVDDFNILREDESAYMTTINVLNYDQDNKPEPNLMRFHFGYRAIPGLHYTQNHYTLRDKIDQSVKNAPRYHTIHMNYSLLKHMRYIRHPNRNAIRGKYYSESIKIYEH